MPLLLSLFIEYPQFSHLDISFRLSIRCLRSFLLHPLLIHFRHKDFAELFFLAIYRLWRLRLADCRELVIRPCLALALSIFSAFLYAISSLIVSMCHATITTRAEAAATAVISLSEFGQGHGVSGMGLLACADVSCWNLSLLTRCGLVWPPPPTQQRPSRCVLLETDSKGSGIGEGGHVIDSLWFDLWYLHYRLSSGKILRAENPFWVAFFSVGVVLSSEWNRIPVSPGLLATVTTTRITLQASTELSFFLLSWFYPTLLDQALIWPPHVANQARFG